MARIEWMGFLGENRALDALDIPQGAGTMSRNQKPGRGDLRPWRNPLTVASVPPGCKTIYRMGRDVASDSRYWLAWNVVVHAMRSFSSTDTTERTFYTGDGTPKVTDNVMALGAYPYPTAHRPMGLPVPETPCFVVNDAGTFTGDVKPFYYFYTYINDWGWESAPSPPSLVNTRPADGTTTISSFAAPPAGNYQINRIRIYRTQGTGGDEAEIFFLREIAYGTSSTQDDGRALGRVLATIGLFPAPDDLSFLTPMWNGMAAGISDGSARVCKEYMEYAWPLENDIVPAEGKAVALGTYGQNLLVLTTGRHVVASGSSSDSLDQQPLDFGQGCISPRSTVSMGPGVAWASQDGLCWYGAGGPRILTAGIMTRDDWMALKPETIIGAMYEGLYFGTYDDGSGRKGFMLDPGNPAGMYFLDAGYESMHFDQLQDQLYVLEGANVKRWDAAATFMTVKAKSRTYLTSECAFACGKVISGALPMTVHIDAIDLDPKYVSRLMVKHPDIYTQLSPTSVRRTTVVISEKMFRLPPVVSRKWQIGIEGGNQAQAIVAASSPAELSKK